MMKKNEHRFITRSHVFGGGVCLILILCMCFCYLFTCSASADTGDLNRIRGYEQVLVHSGDTLDSLAASYAVRYSHGSVAEYKRQIIHLNNLSSEFIREGVYLMMPISHPLRES